MKTKKRKKVFVNDWEMNGVELLKVIEFLEWLGYEVVVRGSMDMMEEGGGYV